MEGGGDASGSGALERPNRSTISQRERAQQKPDPSSPKGRQNEAKAETTGKQRIDTAPQNLRGPEDTHSQREHTGPRIDQGRGDRGGGSEPMRIGAKRWSATFGIEFSGSTMCPIPREASWTPDHCSCRARAPSGPVWKQGDVRSVVEGASDRGASEAVACKRFLLVEAEDRSVSLTVLMLPSARARSVPGATKLFERNSRREVEIPMDEAGVRSGYNGLNRSESVHKVERGHTGGRRGRSSSGALGGQNSSTISRHERGSTNFEYRTNLLPKGDRMRQSRDHTKQSWK